MWEGVMAKKKISYVKNDSDESGYIYLYCPSLNYIIFTREAYFVCL